MNKLLSLNRALHEGIKVKAADLITIIVPTYNSGEYLNVSLPSLLNQSYSNLEILVIDDHSTDPQTLSLLHEYAEREPRIKHTLCEENRGVSYARNLGVTQAQGKYCFFLDDDDYLSLDCIECLHAAAVATQAPLTFCHIASKAAPSVPENTNTATENNILRMIKAAKK